MQETLESLAGVITPVVVLACAVWVGLLALLNVRERRTEIGVLRAIGKGSGRIAALFLGKAVLLGLAGAAIGFPLGSVLAQLLGTRVLGVSPELFTFTAGVLAGRSVRRPGVGGPGQLPADAGRPDAGPGGRVAGFVEARGVWERVWKR